MGAPGLAVPAGDPGQAVGDVLDLDVQRAGLQQGETPAADHALPSAGWTFIRHQASRRRPLTVSVAAKRSRSARSGRRGANRLAISTPGSEPTRRDSSTVTSMPPLARCPRPAIRVSGTAWAM